MPTLTASSHRLRGAAAPPPAAVTSASTATYTAFIGSGVVFASWASRIPQVRDRLDLGPAQLGLLLLAIAVGSLVTLPLAGTVIARFGSRRTVAAAAVVLGLALVVVAVGYLVGVLPVAIGLFLLGFANGAWDVGMNVQGALVERRLGRSLMPRYHAGYSLGTVVGALLGAGMVALRVPVTAHLLVVAIVVTALVAVRAQRFLGDPGPESESGANPVEPTKSGRSRGALSAWREPRTLLIGVVVLTFAFAEGVGNDWISVAAIDGYGLPAAFGTLAFAAFLAAMTASRWLGPALLDRYGRVPVVRALSVLAVTGLLLFVFAPTVPIAYLGTLLWGAGVALGFPVGMSAGADEPQLAPGRVSVIASIGYCAFLSGPPLIGFLGDRYGVLRALVTVAVMLGVAALLAGVLRPPPQQRSATS